MATPFLSYQFPPRPDASHVYLVSFGMDRVLRAMRALSGEAETVEVALKPARPPVRAKRQLFVEVARGPLTFQPVERFRGVPSADTVEFRVVARMSYLDPAYRRLPTHGDVFLVRAALRGGRLTIQISRQEGLGRTGPEDIDRLLRQALEGAK